MTKTVTGQYSIQRLALKEARAEYFTRPGQEEAADDEG